MSGQFIVVHRYGSNNPFLGYGMSVPNRNQARRFNSKDEAESARHEHAKTYFPGKEDHVVVDEWEQPDVEAAFKAVIKGDTSKVPVLQAYKDKVGYRSLLYFAEAAFHAHAYDMFKNWGIV